MTVISTPPHAAWLWQARDRPELTVIAKLAADFPHRQMFPPLGAFALRSVPEAAACPADKSHVEIVQLADGLVAAWAHQPEPRSHNAAPNPCKGNVLSAAIAECDLDVSTFRSYLPDPRPRYPVA